MEDSHSPIISNRPDMSHSCGEQARATRIEKHPPRVIHLMPAEYLAKFSEVLFCLSWKHSEWFHSDVALLPWASIFLALPFPFQI